MITSRIASTIVVLSLVSCLAGEASGSIKKRPAVYPLKLFYGRLDDQVVTHETLINPGHRVSANKSTGPAVIFVPHLGAWITIQPGSMAVTGTFEDDGNVYTYFNLLSGTLDYSETPLSRGGGRKYIVRGRSRALGAIGTEYHLAFQSPNLIRLTVSSGKVGVAYPPDYTKPIAIINPSSSPYDW